MSEIRVNTFKAEDGISAPSFPNGIQVTGVVTATSLASSVPHLNVGDNIQLGAAGVTTATTFVGALTGNATGLSGTPNITVGSVVASTGTFSGNVSVGGTLTYEDVTNIDSVGIVTAREGIFIPDSKQLKIGNTAAAPDLYLWHNSGSGNSNISNKTGDLFIQGNNGSGTVVNQIAVKSNAAVELNYQGTKKFETTSSGVTVTGTVTDSKGDLRKIPFKQESNAYTLVAADAGKAIEAQGNITVPNGVFGSGDAITLINDTASDLTISMGSGLGSMFNVAAGTSGNLTFGGRGMATIYFVNGTTCYISGSRLS